MAVGGGGGLQHAWDFMSPQSNMTAQLLLLYCVINTDFESFVVYRYLLLDHLVGQRMFFA